ncbi:MULTISPECIES: hypothetical protein [Aminobacterium]|jgi:hypothetical protein|nr:MULTISPECIES: hypothetical protein [Aminobacterium]
MDSKKLKKAIKSGHVKQRNEQTDAFANAMVDLNHELYRCRYDS